MLVSKEQKSTLSPSLPPSSSLSLTLFLLPLSFLFSQLLYCIVWHDSIELAQEFLENWKVHVQPPDISEAFVEASLQSVSVNVLMYALGVVIKLAWSHFSLMEEESISSDHGFHETLENKLQKLLENEFERVKLAAAVILHAISQGNEQVGYFLVLPLLGTRIISLLTLTKSVVWCINSLYNVYF